MADAFCDCGYVSSGQTEASIFLMHIKMILVGMIRGARRS